MPWNTGGKEIQRLTEIEVLVSWFFCFGKLSLMAQVFFLDLCSGIIPGRLRGAFGMPGIKYYLL